jgi:hypothetical protein
MTEFLWRAQYASCVTSAAWRTSQTAAMPPPFTATSKALDAFNVVGCGDQRHKGAHRLFPTPTCSLNWHPSGYAIIFSTTAKPSTVPCAFSWMRRTDRRARPAATAASPSVLRRTRHRYYGVLAPNSPRTRPELTAAPRRHCSGARVPWRWYRIQRRQRQRRIRPRKSRDPPPATSG